MLKLSNDEIVQLYLKKSCNISATCSALKISRTTWYRWLKGDPELKQLINDSEQALLDNAETMLYKKVTEGDLTAIIFTLKTKGKNRGYTERVEFDDVVDTKVLTREEKIARARELEEKARKLKNHNKSIDS